MKQSLKATAKQRNKPTSPWIKYCIIAAGLLLIFAGLLYIYRYISLDREFHSNIRFFEEETYEEIFALTDTKTEAESVMEQAEKAFSFIGTEEEAAEQFGALSRYSCTDSGAVSEEHTLDYIISKIGDTGGYIWVAYTQVALDPGGEAVSGSGSEKQRILSRWTVEKDRDGQWMVTEIQEAP